MWTVTAETADGPRTVTANILLQNSGYYRYDEGYTPHFEGRERFRGQIVHPQHWPEDLDYAGKRVVVIGSGATAVTLVPAMAKDAGHVTMLQRSPSYVISLPESDPLANLLGKLPAKLSYPVVRWANVLRASLFYEASQRFPGAVKKVLRAMTAKQLPDTVDVDTHFKPRYNPWDQRLCLVPNGDLFRAFRHGDASVVTDTIKTFTETGIELDSGQTLDADIIITATGLNLLAFGGTQFTVDGEPVHLPDLVAYKGMMLTGMPNFIYTLGYTNASWTLKADLVSEYACRLINHMDEHGYKQAVPELNDPTVTPEPFLDFQAGYVLRSVDQLPKQGSKAPWKLRMNYPIDVVALRHGTVTDDGMVFTAA
jgi:cation diffusion facilitator CzcD-associated flavoprotein CzcO